MPVRIHRHHLISGDHIEFYPLVPRRGNHPSDPGGLVGVTTSSRLGTINMFYTFDLGTRNQQTYVEIAAIHRLGSIGSMYVVQEIPRNEARLDGFDRVPSGPTEMIHIDSICFKIKLAPRLEKIASKRMRSSSSDNCSSSSSSSNSSSSSSDEGYGEDTLMALRMWEAR